MFWFLLGLNVIYVVAEFSYNAHLLVSLAGSSPDIEQLELLGRSLSSFGATFLFYKLIASLDLNLKRKICAIFLISLIVYPSVYIGQKELVELLVRNSSLEQREKYADLLIVRNGWANDGLEIGGLPKIENDIESKVFLNVFGLLNSSNNSLLEKYRDNKEEIIDRVFRKSMIDDFEGSYAKDYLRMSKEFNSYYKKYLEAVDRHYNSPLDSEEAKGKVYYAQLKSNEDRIYRKNYYELKEFYWKAEKYAKDYIDYVYRGGLKVVAFNSVKSSEARKAKFVKEQERRIAFMASKGLNVDFLKVVEFDDVCRVYNGKGFQYIASKDLKGKYVNEKSGASRLDLAYEYKVVCNVGNLQAKYNNLLVKIERAIKSKSGLDSLEYSSAKQLVQDPNYVNWVASEVLKKEVKGRIRYYNEEVFVNDYLKVVAKEYAAAFENKSKALYGFALPVNIDSPEDFISNPSFKNFVKNELGVFFIDKFEFGLGLEDYVQKLGEDMLVYKVQKYMDIDLNSEEGEKVVKAMIVPSVALFFSIFFGVINLIVLFRSLSLQWVKNKKAIVSINVFYIVVAGFIVVAPLSMDNALIDSAYYVALQNGVFDNNIAIPYAMKWLINVEPILFSLGDNIVHYL